MPPAPPRPAAMAPREWGLLAALSVLWGGSFLFVGTAVRELPPLTIVLARVGLAALALHLALLATGVRLPARPRVWLAFAGMGALNNALPFALIVWGQTRLASGLAAILNATTPVFGVLVAHALTRDEKLTPGRALGVLLGVAGVASTVGPGALRAPGSELLPALACLAAALSYALAGVYGRRFRAMGVPPLATAAGQVTASTLLLLPLALALERPWALPAPGPATLAAVAALALLSTALAYVLYFKILAAAGATNILLVTLLVPASAVALGALLLGERFEARHGLGMALIGLGLAAIDGRPWAALRRQRRRPAATGPGGP